MEASVLRPLLDLMADPEFGMVDKAATGEREQRTMGLTEVEGKKEKAEEREGWVREGRG